mgnify:CR=1 FL=1
MDTLRRSFYWFMLGTVVLFPFQYHLFELHTKTINYLFSPIIFKLAKGIGLNPYFQDLSSDSKNLFVFVGCIGLLSMLLALFGFLKKRFNTSELAELTRSIVSLFLTLILLKYGLDKIFQQQFPIPEPNLLYTSLGQLDKDILYWSTMGSSYSYNLFLGFTEVIAGLLLFLRKTSALGSLAAVFIFINVLAVNLSFDISVKLFSGLLLLMSFFLARHHLLCIVSTQPAENQTEQLGYTLKGNVKIQIGIALLILAEALFPYFKSANHADELTLYGAYEAIHNSDNNSLKRIFIHSDNYLIFQDQNDEMASYRMDHDAVRQTIFIRNEDQGITTINYKYNPVNSELTLNGITDNPLRLRKIDHEKLPLLQPLFHWTVD